MKRTHKNSRRMKKLKKTLLILFIAFYISFILTSTVQYLAEQKYTKGVLSNGEYISHLFGG